MQPPQAHSRLLSPLQRTLNLSQFPHLSSLQLHQHYSIFHFYGFLYHGQLIRVELLYMNVKISTVGVGNPTWEEAANMPTRLLQHISGTHGRGCKSDLFCTTDCLYRYCDLPATNPRTPTPCTAPTHGVGSVKDVQVSNQLMALSTSVHIAPFLFLPH